MYEESLEKFSVAHQDIRSCQNKAKRYFYWPNRMIDVKNFVNSCKMCRKYQKLNTKDAMIPYNVHKNLWLEMGIHFMYL